MTEEIRSFQINSLYSFVFGTLYFSVQFRNGGNSYGAVEVYKNNVWGTICPESFGTFEASKSTIIFNLIEIVW